ncbi:cation:proton antiporter [Candidatus Microgenomates bacterium]|nr:cation:proton antiporter [Candidatus Microgenomates bacterium]
MEAGFFAEISVILAIATVVAGVAHYLRQPLIIGHIFTGILVGPVVFNLVRVSDMAELFSHIGIALLLFIIGLGLNPRIIKEVGKVSLLTGLGQIIFTSLLGFGIAQLLGFAVLTSLYIAVALTFSSTIIILKILSDKRETHQLYGKIATGFLLVQDLVAVLILIFVSSFLAQSKSLAMIGITALKGFGLALSLALIAKYLLPRLVKQFARSQEYLFLFSIGWGFGVAALFMWLGFSIEIGALAAGVALASSGYSYEISARMRPLRDFFIILFFIVLGAGMTFGNLTDQLVPALIFSVFILLGNPLVVMAIMGALGYRLKTSFKAGLTVAQISEFSLVLVVLGQRVGQLSAEVVSLVTLVGLITIAGSTYMMIYDDQLYRWLAGYLRVFERRHTKSAQSLDQKYDVYLFGYQAGGNSFIQTLAKLGRPYLVIDYDPEVIDHLQSQNIPHRYGDANDAEFLADLDLEKARLVVINLSDFAANALIVGETRRVNQRAIVIAMTDAEDKVEEALELYDRGASYVMMPRYLGSLKVGNLLRRYDLDRAKFRQAQRRHQQLLTQTHSAD